MNKKHVKTINKKNEELQQKLPYTAVDAPIRGDPYRSKPLTDP